MDWLKDSFCFEKYCIAITILHVSSRMYMTISAANDNSQLMSGAFVQRRGHMTKRHVRGEVVSQLHQICALA